VITLHEFGHFPKRIIWKKAFGLIPYSAAAMQAKYRLGGIIVNVLLFVLVYYFKPEQLLLQFVGLVSWLHFIVYAIAGSIIPEPKLGSMNNKYVYDDIPNKFAMVFIGIAIFVLIYFQDYYFNILRGIIPW